MDATTDIRALLAEKREEILALAALHGAYNVRIFGSVARGDAGPDSDIDFLVEFEPDRSLMDMSRLLLDLQDLLGREVDLVEEEGLYHLMRADVLAEAVSL